MQPEDENETENISHNPLIIAEMETDVMTQSVGEAVMQLELKESSFYVFNNEKSNQLNVVYKRDDGNIGWIEPKV